ncbi:MAG: ABC transporter ATP-binding protein, partial [Clostridia bacterium]|nr:ABC transporter ATP-binding protein [Clostridia bacterium]
MIKLLKGLKPYRFLIMIVIALVSCTAIASLYLPDRMSKIIGEGITTEMVQETYFGETVYINGSLMGTEDIPLFKMVHANAGELVIDIDEETGRNYVRFVSLFPFAAEVDKDGNTVGINAALMGVSAADLPPMMLTESGNMKIPQFLRTDNGKADGATMQGYLLLDDSGSVQVESRQISNTKIIWTNGFIMLAITLGSSIFSIIVAFISSRVAMGFGYDVRKKIFAKVVSFSQQEDIFGTSTLITRATNDVQQVQQLVMMAQRMMLSVPVMFIGGILMALKKDARMTIVLLVTLPVITGIILLIARTIIPMFKKMQKRIDALTRVTRENITGVRVVRAFQADELEDKRFDERNKDVAELGLKTGRIMASLMPIMTFIMSGTLLSIMMIASFRTDALVRSGGTNFQVLGNMMAVIQYVVQIMMSVIMLTMIIIMVPRASVSANRIIEVLDSDNPIKDTENAIALSESAQNITFNNVSFKFPNAAQAAIKDISFSAKRGEFVAIVGSTGSGKSTLINLLPRLYDVTEGSIAINGKDIREITMKSVRAKIGFVPQKALLFSGTIKENLLYGATDVSEENIKEAARIAQATDFIYGKEDGFYSEVEQNGANFSGGQKQRLSIARAIARKPEIYIFDDSFS